jgi:apolipoprotein D and lipocalin family protein
MDGELPPLGLWTTLDAQKGGVMRTGMTMALLVCVGWGAMAAETPLRVVETVDVARYMGLWYSIASIPTTFEKKCVQGTTAEYTLLDNGKIQVVNTCYDASGSRDVARGQAWIPDSSEPTKLKVSFVRFLGIWWFGAPYWIIDLAPDYSYAVVGHPSRDYGWILSRTPALPDDVLACIIERLEAQGYRFSDFVKMDQSIHIQSHGA